MRAVTSERFVPSPARLLASSEYVPAGTSSGTVASIVPCVDAVTASLCAVPSAATTKSPSSAFAAVIGRRHAPA